MKPRIIQVVEGCEIGQFDPTPDAIKGRIEYLADADIDADGGNGQSGRWSYLKGDKGAEALANAGFPNHPSWYRSILLCDQAGSPIAFPGGGIASKTAYEWRRKAATDPTRWVDAFSVPYAVAQSGTRKTCRGALLGCRARMTNMATGVVVEGVVADIGPLNKIGEVSIRAAELLGLNSDPRRGGTSDRIIKYEFFPGMAATVDGVTYDLQAA